VIVIIIDYKYLIVYNQVLNFLGIVEPVSTGQAANDYLTRTVTPTLLKGLTELCKMKPADPIVSLHCNLYMD